MIDLMLHGTSYLPRWVLWPSLVMAAWLYYWLFRFIAELFKIASAGG